MTRVSIVAAETLATLQGQINTSCAQVEADGHGVKEIQVQVVSELGAFAVIIYGSGPSRTVVNTR